MSAHDIRERVEALFADEIRHQEHRAAESIFEEKRKHQYAADLLTAKCRELMALLEEGERVPDGWMLAWCNHCDWTGCIETGSNVCPDCSAASLHPSRE